MLRSDRKTKTIRECAKKQIKIFCLCIGSAPRKSFEYERSVCNSAKGLFFDIYDFDNSNASKISDLFKDLVIRAAISASPKNN